MYVLTLCLLLCGFSLAKSVMPSFSINLPSKMKDQKLDRFEMLKADFTDLNTTLTETVKKMDELRGQLLVSSSQGSSGSNADVLIKTLEEKHANLATKVTSLFTKVQQRSGYVQTVSALQKEITTIKSGLEGLKTSVDKLQRKQTLVEGETMNGINTDLDDLQSKQKALENKMMKLEESSEGMASKLTQSSDFEAEIASLKSTQKQLQTDTSQLATAVNGIEVPDKASSTIVRLASSKSYTRKTGQNLQLTLTDMKKALEDLNANHRTSSKQIATLQESFATFQKNFQDLSTSTGEVAKKQKELSALDIPAMVSELKELKTQVKTIADGLAAVNAQEVGKLRAKVDSLLEDMNAFKSKVSTERKTDQKAHAADIDFVKKELMKMETSVASTKKDSEDPNESGGGNGGSAPTYNRLTFVKIKKSFSSALKFCEKSLKGSLAVLNTKNKLDLTLEKVTGYYTWAGLKRTSSNSPFYWTGGQGVVTDVNWKNGEHSGMCGQIAIHQGKVWFKTDDCDVKKYFVCEY